MPLSTRRRVSMEHLEGRRLLAVLLSADFSDATGAADAEGFTTSGPADEWHLSTGRGNVGNHTADNSFYFGSGENALGGGSYGVNADGVLTSPVVDLTDASSAELSFNHFIEVEQDFDFATVSVLQGGISTVIATSGMELPTDTANFEFESLDLTNFVGAPLQVQFRLTTDAIETREGWYVDDVTVTVPEPADINIDFTDEAGQPDAEGFTSSGPNNQWHLSTGRGDDANHTGVDSFYFGAGEDITGGGTYSNNADGTLLSPVFDLTGRTNPTLNFNHFLDVEPNFDFATVSVIHPDGTDVLGTSGSEFSNNTDIFQAVTFDLSPYVGDQIRVAFQFTSDAVFSREGWYVDDVSIDDDGPGLPSGMIVELADDFMSENGGATTGVVRLTGGSVGPLTINLESSDLTEARVPATVFVPPGETISLPFDVTAVDDTIVDGVQTVGIRAFVDGNVELDARFGDAGLASTPLRMNLDPPRNALGIQNDGKLLAASEGTATNEIVLIRQNPDGTTDETFGTMGLATTEFATDRPVPHSIVVQSDGKILVGGRHAAGEGSPFIVRYNIDGTIDTSYGAAGFASLESVDAMWIENMSLTPDDGVVAALANSGTVQFSAMRVNSLGQLDEGFGMNGLQTYAGIDALARDVTVLPSGSFLLTGGLNTQAQIVRALPNGDLDTSFGIAGQRSIDFGGMNVDVHTVDVDRNSKIVIGANLSAVDGGSQFGVARLNADGNLDTTFSADGIVMTDVIPGDDVNATSLVIQSDNKIVVTGYLDADSNEMAVVRYRTDGSLDSSFANDGLFQFAAGISTNQRSFDSILQPDGRLVMVSGWFVNFDLVRVNLGRIEAVDMIDVLDDDLSELTVQIFDEAIDENGGTTSGVVVRSGDLSETLQIQLTATSSADGTVTQVVTIPAGQSTSNSFKITAIDDTQVDGDQTLIITASQNSPSLNFPQTSGDGSVLILEDDAYDLSIEIEADEMSENGGETEAVVRLADGVTGPVEVTLSSSDTTEAVVQQTVLIPAGRSVSAPFIIDAVDDALFDGTQTVTVTATIDVAGTKLVRTFGDAGIAPTPLETRIQPPSNAIATQADGKILAASAGPSTNDLILVRHNPDGTLDTDFGDQGIITTVFPIDWPSPKSMAVQPDGKIVVGGRQGRSSTEPFLIRYNADGTLDETFGTDGFANLGGLTSMWVEELTLTPEGKILSAMNILGPLNFRATRVTSDGELDTTFGDNGLVTYANQDFIAWTTELLDNGNFLLAGRWNGEVVVLRGLDDGSIDTTFGNNGVTVLDLGDTFVRPREIEIDSQGRILVGIERSASQNKAVYTVARLTADGVVDAQFGTAGIATSDLTVAGDSLSTSLVVQPNDKVVLAGYRTEPGQPNDIALTRFSVDGSIDMEFGTDGVFPLGFEDQTFVRAYESVLTQEGNLLLLTGNQDQYQFVQVDIGLSRISTATDVVDVLDDEVIEIESILINDGSAQRSQVTSLTVQFNTIIEADPLMEAFKITNVDTGDNVGDISVNLTEAGGKTTAVLTFDGASVTSRLGLGGLSNSLADGNYRLVISADKVISPTSGDTLPEDRVFGDPGNGEVDSDDFFRLYGDSNGDRDVDGQDYGIFGTVFMSAAGDANYRPHLDSDGDGDVDGRDYGVFGINFLSQI